MKMSDSILGIPLTTWGVVCLGVAVVYFFFWPKPKADDQAPPRSPRVHFVLRWFHSIVWLLLAAACFLWAGGNSMLANGLALLALALYLVFVVTLFSARKSRKPVP